MGLEYFLWFLFGKPYFQVLYVSFREFNLRVEERWQKKNLLVGWVGDIFGRFYPPWNQQLHSVRTRNTGVGRWVSFWEGLLPRAMLVLGSVPWEIIIFNHQFGDYFNIFSNHRRSKSRKASCRCWVWYVWIYMQTHTELASRCTCFQASRACPLRCAKTTGLHRGERQRSELSERSCGEDSGSSSAWLVTVCRQDWLRPTTASLTTGNGFMFWPSVKSSWNIVQLPLNCGHVIVGEILGGQHSREPISAGFLSHEGIVKGRFLTLVP